MKLLAPALRSHDGLITEPGDSAAAGQHAEFRVHCRGIWVEVQRRLGRHAAAILWDIRQFYDNIDPQTTAKDLIDQNAPAPESAIAMLLHQCPRRLRIQGCFGPQTGIGRSILAGCTSSTSIARTVLKVPLQQARESVCNLKQGAHVDDVSQAYAHESLESVYNSLSEAGQIFVDVVKARKLSFSQDVPAKSVVLASSKQLGIQLGRFFACSEVRVEVLSKSEDLGIGVAANGRRTMSKLSERMRKDKVRASRIGWLRKRNTRASTLWKQGARPMQSYGSCQQGLSPTHRAALNRSALAAIAPNGTQACTVTNLYIQFNSIPEVDYMKQQFSWWVRYWGETVAEGGQELEDLKLAWRIARDEAQLQPANLRWKHVTSGMSAIITLLLWMEARARWQCLEGRLSTTLPLSKPSLWQQRAWLGKELQNTMEGKGSNRGDLCSQAGSVRAGSI